MKNYISFLAILFAVVVLSSCELINPEEPAPSYLYVDEFAFSTNYSTQGTDTLPEITDAWLLVDGVFLGVYRLPAKIPVLLEGAREVQLLPGIKDNGVGVTPEIYPFYKKYVRTIDLTPLQVDTIRPTTTYKDDTKFTFIQDYESSSVSLTDTRLGSVSVTRSTQDAFQGQYSGRLVLDTANAFVEIATDGRFSDIQPNVSQPVYLEIHYRSEAAVIWGLIGHESGASGLGQGFFNPGFKPNNEWQKIYFNLTAIADELMSDEYQLAFQAGIVPDENGNTPRTAIIQIDNLKLVHK